MVTDKTKAKPKAKSNSSSTTKTSSNTTTKKNTSSNTNSNNSKGVKPNPSDTGRALPMIPKAGVTRDRTRRYAKGGRLKCK